MKLGFTYDLKSDYLALGFSQEQAAEFDAPETIEGISRALLDLGHQVELIGNVHSLLHRLLRGDRWDLVFNICEGMYGLGREAQVPAILDVYKIPYTFSDVVVLSVTLHKAMTKRIVRDLGIPTAPFFVVEKMRDISENNLPFPLFVKPVAEGTGKGIGPHSKVRDAASLEKVCRQLLNTYDQAVLVEAFLPGKEITAGIVGTGEGARVIGMMEVVFGEKETTGIYSYDNKAHYEQFIKYHPVTGPLYDECSRVALSSWRGLGCRDGGRVDLRLDEKGVPNFMEVNPLAGLNPLHSDLPILARMAGISFNGLIGMIMNSAIERIGLTQNQEAL